jgi:hypothetical protein
MKKAILKITILSLFAAALVAAPVVTRAQVTTNTTTATAKGKKAKKTALLIFAGKVSAVDTNAMTLTVGKHVFDITAETKITKDGQPAAFADATVGETASGTYKKESDAKLSAVTVSFSTKAAATKKKKKAAASTGTTNSTAK